VLLWVRHAVVGPLGGRKEAQGGGTLSPEQARSSGGESIASSGG
jgi:hypothetical protein